MIAKKFCPRCESEDVEMIAAGTTGTWMCRNCGFTGIFPEKTLVGSEMRMDDVKKEKKIWRKKKWVIK